MGTIIAVVLGLAAVIVYFKGAKPEKPWGTPLLALLVIGAVVAVVLPRTGMLESQTSVAPMTSVSLLGRACAGELSDGARILLIRRRMDAEMVMGDVNAEGPPEGDPAKVREQYQQKVKKALEKGFGGSVELVAVEPPGLSDEWDPRGETADAFNAVLKKYRNENVDALISTIGLPRSPEGQLQVDRLTLDQMSPEPLFVANVGLKYDPDNIRRLIEEGTLHAAVLNPSVQQRKPILVNKDNLDDLPDDPPVPSAVQGTR